jgi:type II secretory pathway component HofQ
VLRSIHVEPGFFSFAPSTGALTAAGSIAAAQDGSIRIFLFLGGVPIPGTPVLLTVQNGEVTDVQPREIQIGSATIDESAVESFLAGLPAGSRPELSAWQSMTIDEVVAEINTALASASIPFAIGVEATGDLSGTLRLSEIQFDAQVALSSD